MIIEKIGEGNTIEEAQENAKTLLNAPENADIKFDIVSLPSKKVLGLFGGKKAQVKAYYEKKDSKREKRTPAKKRESKPKNTKPEKKTELKKEVSSQKKEEKTEISVTPERLEDAKNKACEYTKTVLEKMLEKEVSVTANADGKDSIYLTVNCEDHDIDGIVIGRRGETLDALQYLASLIANKGHDDYVRVTLDIANYREKRQATLVALAQKNAKHVLRSGRRVTLEPMNPYERHIIHTAVQEIEGVKSHSIGSNIDRRVVISPEDGFRPQGGGRRGSGNRNSYKPHIDENRVPKKDNAEAPLYGIISKD